VKRTTVILLFQLVVFAQMGSAQDVVEVVTPASAQEIVQPTDPRPAVVQIHEKEVEPDLVIDEFGTVSLVANELEITQVLKMLAIKSRKNIIASSSVSGAVSANLYDVTFNEALDAILKVNGFGYIEEGNFVYVYTLDELDTIKKSSLKTQSRIYELQYLSAFDANEFVKPLLSEDGAAAFRGDVEAGYQPSLSDGGGDSYAWTSKLVVNDYPENLEAIATLLATLDTPPAQVVVEATILQTKVTEDNEFGVDFTALSNIEIGSITGGPLSAASNLIDGTFGNKNTDAFSTGVGSTDTSISGGLKVGVIKDHVGAFLRVLDQVVDTTVLARPRVTCLNRQRAEVLIGTRVGYLSSTQTQTSTTQTVQFLDTGIQLVFRPFISPDGMIRMELQPNVSSATLREDGDQTVPDEITQQLTTNVRCRDGETIILGGLFRETTTLSRNQVPFLGDIPIIGNLFRGHDDQIEKEEIIFLLTPTIIKDERMWESGRDSLESVDAVRVGSRAGLLPFSCEQITANYNRDAIDAYRIGDLEKALYWSNLSLHSASLQPEIIRLRHRITDEKDSTWEQDLRRELIKRECKLLNTTVGVTQ
jgi:type IV pilus assembly protein PilQ